MGVPRFLLYLIPIYASPVFQYREEIELTEFFVRLFMDLAEASLRKSRQTLSPEGGLRLRVRSCTEIGIPLALFWSILGEGRCPYNIDVINPPQFRQGWLCSFHKEFPDVLPPIVLDCYCV